MKAWRSTAHATFKREIVGRCPGRNRTPSEASYRTDHLGNQGRPALPQQKYQLGSVIIRREKNSRGKRRRRRDRPGSCRRAYPMGVLLSGGGGPVQKASVLRLIREEIRSLTPDLSSGQTFATIIVSSNRAAVWAAKLYDLEEMATLESIPFTRRWPKSSARCRNMAREERSEILSHLESMGRSWQDAGTSLIAEEYFVYEENGRILAGVQACPQHLLVASLGSKLDRITFAIMPLVLGKSADDFHLVQLHHAWGKKEVFDELWSHVPARAWRMYGAYRHRRARSSFCYIRYDLKRGLASRISGIETMAVSARAPSLPSP